MDHRTIRQLCRHDRPIELEGPGRDLQPAVRGEQRQGGGQGQDRRRVHSGAETGMQLEPVTSCIPVSAPLVGKALNVFNFVQAWTN